MDTSTILQTALGGYKKVPYDWMSATQVRPLILEDPGAVWLKFHGEKHGLLPDEATPYEFSHFIFEKGSQFQDTWIKEIAGNAVRVCKNAYQVTSADKVKETCELIQKQESVIAQACPLVCSGKNLRCT